MSKSVYDIQNESILLKCIAAQREEYSICKKIGKFKFVLSVIIVTIFTIITSVTKNNIVSSVSVVFAFLLIIVNRVFNDYIAKKKNHAADIQQYIDVKIYSKVTEHNCEEWGTIISDSQIAESTINISQNKMDDVRNWYSDYSKFDPMWQVFYCQKENLRWDSKLKKEYKWFISIVSTIIFLILIMLSIAINPTVLSCISVIAWIFPVADYTYSVYRELCDEAERFKNMQMENENIDILLNNNEYRLAYFKQIELQRKIWNNRKNSILVPDWFYKKRKDKHQHAEDSIAENTAAIKSEEQ